MYMYLSFTIALPLSLPPSLPPSLSPSLTHLCILLHGHLDEYLSLNAVILGDRGQRKPLINPYDVITTSSIKKSTHRIHVYAPVTTHLLAISQLFLCPASPSQEAPSIWK
jgi:hypothetical protein